MLIVLIIMLIKTKNAVKKSRKSQVVIQNLKTKKNNVKAKKIDIKPKKI